MQVDTFNSGQKQQKQAKHKHDPMPALARKTQMGIKSKQDSRHNQKLLITRFVILASGVGLHEEFTGALY